MFFATILELHIEIWSRKIKVCFLRFSIDRIQPNFKKKLQISTHGSNRVAKKEKDVFKILISYLACQNWLNLHVDHHHFGYIAKLTHTKHHHSHWSIVVPAFFCWLYSQKEKLKIKSAKIKCFSRFSIVSNNLTKLFLIPTLYMVQVGSQKLKKVFFFFKF